MLGCNSNALPVQSGLGNKFLNHGYVYSKGFRITRIYIYETMTNSINQPVLLSEQSSSGTHTTPGPPQSSQCTAKCQLVRMSGKQCSPLVSLQAMLEKKNSMDSEDFADFMDREDPLKRFRDKFQFPTLGSMPCGKTHCGILSQHDMH